MFQQNTTDSDIRELVYTTSYANQEVIVESCAGLDLDNCVWELTLDKKINSPKCWMDNLGIDSIPYRYSNRSGDLLQNNDLILNLNEACQIEDIDWIKPSNLFRDVILTTESAFKAIDFCAEHKIPYVLFCWRWYIPVTSHDGDALMPVSKFDIHRAISYAKQKDIGVWVYLNQHALQKPNIDVVLDSLRNWSVVGIKPGFVEYCSHRWVVWVHEIVRLAAKHQQMVILKQNWFAKNIDSNELI